VEFRGILAGDRPRHHILVRMTDVRRVPCLATLGDTPAERGAEADDWHEPTHNVTPFDISAPPRCIAEAQAASRALRSARRSSPSSSIRSNAQSTASYGEGYGLTPCLRRHSLRAVNGAECNGATPASISGAYGC
jgi:hypothetical protein